jgi:hypothetical protein
MPHNNSFLFNKKMKLIILNISHLSFALFFYGVEIMFTHIFIFYQATFEIKIQLDVSIKFFTYIIDFSLKRSK